MMHTRSGSTPSNKLDKRQISELTPNPPRLSSDNDNIEILNSCYKTPKQRHFADICIQCIHYILDAIKPAFGVSDKASPIPACSATEIC